MGKRKRLVAEARKEANKSTYFAKLNSCPTSPRKMRQVADLVRGMEAYKALNVLKFNTREASGRLENLQLQITKQKQDLVQRKIPYLLLR